MTVGSFALASVAVAISLVNLLLILGIVRRMRQMEPMVPAAYFEIEFGSRARLRAPGVQCANDQRAAGTRLSTRNKPRAHGFSLGGL